MEWAQLLSSKRFGLEGLVIDKTDDRSEFLRDYDRLVFSAAFRRLQNKTQVFPLPGSIFVHNRLTHSLEVSCVGRSIGAYVSRKLIQLYPALTETAVPDISSIIAAACLAHDMGNPPFGHSGEKAISTFFSEGDGLHLKNEMTNAEWNDLIHFEGNANAFRLLTHQFSGRRPGGFVLTYSTLASIVKYPYVSQLAGDKSKFGFFTSETAGFERIATELGIKKTNGDHEPIRFARHPLVYLVEAADDICYQLMDIEDAHKLKILTTEETKALYSAFLDEKGKNRAESVCKHVTDINEQIAYYRSVAVGILIRACSNTFLEHEAEILEGNFSGTLIQNVEKPLQEAYELCARISAEKIYHSRAVVDIELAGFNVITTLMRLMTNAVFTPEKTYSRLLINRMSAQYDITTDSIYGKIQAVLDYISGMTDVFALDLYQKIKGYSLTIA